MLSFRERIIFWCRKFLRAAARWHLCAFKLKALSSVTTLIVREWTSFSYTRYLADHYLNVIRKQWSLRIRTIHLSALRCWAMKKGGYKCGCAGFKQNIYTWSQTLGEQLKRGDVGIATHCSDCWTLKQSYLCDKYVQNTPACLDWENIHYLLT